MSASFNSATQRSATFSEVEQEELRAAATSPHVFMPHAQPTRRPLSQTLDAQLSMSLHSETRELASSATSEVRAHSNLVVDMGDNVQPLESKSQESLTSHKSAFQTETSS